MIYGLDRVENMVGKGENAGVRQCFLVASILSFSHNVFYPIQNKFQYLVTLILSSANAFNLDQPENLSFDKDL